MQALCQSCREACLAMCSLIQETFPDGTRVIWPQGGLHIWVVLPDQYDTVKLLPLALEKSISFSVGCINAPG